MGRPARPALAAGKRLDQVVGALLARHPAPAQDDPAAWLQESRELAWEAVYPPTGGGQRPVIDENFAPPAGFSPTGAWWRPAIAWAGCSTGCSPGFHVEPIGPPPTRENKLEFRHARPAPPRRPPRLRLPAGLPARRRGPRPSPSAPPAPRIDRGGLPFPPIPRRRRPGCRVTGTVVLAESHFALHTWPEIRGVTLDVYVCNFSADNSALAHGLFAETIAAFTPGPGGPPGSEAGRIAGPAAAPNRYPFAFKPILCRPCSSTVFGSSSRLDWKANGYEARRQIEGVTGRQGMAGEELPHRQALAPAFCTSVRRRRRGRRRRRYPFVHSQDRSGRPSPGRGHGPPHLDAQAAEAGLGAGKGIEGTDVAVEFLGAAPPVDDRLGLFDLGGVGDAGPGLGSAGSGRLPRASTARAAPRAARRSWRLPAVSSGAMARACRSKTGPVSRPASICMMHTPVSPSPASKARWMGRRPASAAAGTRGC